MTKDDIIKLAKKVGLCVDKELQPELIVFSSLVAAAEREECAKVCEAQKVGYPSYFEIDERIQKCAAAIRARGTT